MSSDSRRQSLASACRAVTEAGWFEALVFWLILANAVVLGIETYEGMAEAWRPLLKAVEHTVLAAFTVEAALRAGAHADRPRAYFRDPWNVFDLTVVLLAYLPYTRENATVLRLLRLARVLRAARMLPQLRIIIVAIGKSVPGAMGFVLAGTLLLYVYAMFGWLIFAERDPEHYGSLGRAALSLFLLVTLDGLGESVRAGMEISPWSVLYFASYVLLGSFVLVNVLIGVVLNSLDEARRMEDARAAGPAVPTVSSAPPSPPSPPSPPLPPSAVDAERELRLRLAEARAALDALQQALDSPADVRVPGVRHSASDHRMSAGGKSRPPRHSA